MARIWPQASLACSFCHKGEKTVGKLISSPSDYPRAYICDECIAVCSSIVEDDKDAAIEDPLLEEFLAAAQAWIESEPPNENDSEQLSRMGALARQLFAEPASN